MCCVACKKIEKSSDCRQALQITFYFFTLTCASSYLVVAVYGRYIRTIRSSNFVFEIYPIIFNDRGNNFSRQRPVKDPSKTRQRPSKNNSTELIFEYTI